MALRKPRNQGLAEIQAELGGQESKDNWHSYSCKLVTPMYGGGVEAGKVDKDMPIRASAIRGQLRFWWRVACASSASPAEMFLRETAIWGGMAGAGPTASKVKVRVCEIKNLKLEPAHTYVSNPNKPGERKTLPDVANWADGYALFSAQGKLNQGKRDVEDEPKEMAREGIEFLLKLCFGEKLTSQQLNEIETALRWWASFGGIGARTRRGLGALKIDGLKPVTEEDVRRQHGKLALLPAEDNPTSAWKTSIGRLKDFRQKKGVGRNPPAQDSKSPAGRSLWPEADALRNPKLSNQSSERHCKRLVQGDVFPRAAFGLPIVFHFNDRTDPCDHILEPADVSTKDKRDRMASPLILRPYWNGDKWQAAALLLPKWEEALKQPLKFKGQNYKPEHWPTDAKTRQVKARFISPMMKDAELRADDPLSAFMHYFEKGQ